MSNFVIGWVDAYDGNYPIATFSSERKKALVEKIRQRKYNFNFTDSQFLPNCTPYYDDGKICILTKKEFDETIREAYKDRPIGARLLPADVIHLPVTNGILFEKEKYLDNFKEGNSNV
mgnify:CR=1 FL=1